MTQSERSISRLPFVRSLLFSRGPAYVPRFIVAIYVDAVDCVCRCWFGAYMRKERSEGRFPLRTDTDPTPAIVAIRIQRQRWKNTFVFGRL